MEGRTAICIFEGIINKELFVNILDLTLPWKRSREDEFNQWRREFSCVLFIKNEPAKHKQNSFTSAVSIACVHLISHYVNKYSYLKRKELSLTLRWW